MRFEPIGTEDQIEHLATMATEIWREYWPAIIGQEQTDYMGEKFQSFPSLSHDILDESYEYWFLVDEKDDEDRIVGYTGILVHPEDKSLFISKLYMYANERGKGYASRAVHFFEHLCETRHLERMYLTVNKHNELAIRAYKKLGFETIESVETDIGNGFIMDDYIMEKRVGDKTA